MSVENVLHFGQFSEWIEKVKRSNKITALIERKMHMSWFIDKDKKQPNNTGRIALERLRGAQFYYNKHDTFSRCRVCYPNRLTLLFNPDF